MNIRRKNKEWNEVKELLEAMLNEGRKQMEEGGNNNDKPSSTTEDWGHLTPEEMEDKWERTKAKNRLMNGAIIKAMDITLAAGLNPDRIGTRPYLSAKNKAMLDSIRDGASRFGCADYKMLGVVAELIKELEGLIEVQNAAMKIVKVCRDAKKAEQKRPRTSEFEPELHTMAVGLRMWACTLDPIWMLEEIRTVVNWEYVIGAGHKWNRDIFQRNK